MRKLDTVTVALIAVGVFAAVMAILTAHFS
jgi:hypothetical protein